MRVSHCHIIYYPFLSQWDCFEEIDLTASSPKGKSPAVSATADGKRRGKAAASVSQTRTISSQTRTAVKSGTRGGKSLASSSGASTSSGVQSRGSVSHRGKVNFGRGARKVLTAPKGQDPPTRVLGGQQKMEGKSRGLVRSVAVSRKGKGPLSGNKITHKTLVRRKGRVPQRIPASQGSSKEVATSPIVPAPSSRKRCFEESSSPGLSPRRKAPVAMTSSRRNHLQRKLGTLSGNSDGSEAVLGQPCVDNSPQSPEEILSAVSGSEPVLGQDNSPHSSEAEPALGQPYCPPIKLTVSGRSGVEEPCDDKSSQRTLSVVSGNSGGSEPALDQFCDDNLPLSSLGVASGNGGGSDDNCPQSSQINLSAISGNSGDVGGSGPALRQPPDSVGQSLEPVRQQQLELAGQQLELVGKPLELVGKPLELVGQPLELVGKPLDDVIKEPEKWTR